MLYLRSCIVELHFILGKAALKNTYFLFQFFAATFKNISICVFLVDCSWNVMTRGNAREGKWRGDWRMEWVASTLRTTSEHGVSSITTTDAHTSAASSRLNWRPCRFKWTGLFRLKTKSGFCVCAITFQMQSTTSDRFVEYEKNMHLCKSPLAVGVMVVTNWG